MASSNKSVPKPFKLLEVNMISAQDLARVCRNMRTYAVAWINPDRKLSTRVDNDSNTDPTWNDKFVFRVDEGFLHGDTSAIMVEIYTQHWFRDIHVGTVRVMVGNVVGVNHPPKSHRRHVGMTFLALQVRRPSGRAQGILNIGVTVLDSSMQSMPLYNQLGSAVGYRDIMGASPSNVEDQETNLNYYNADNIPAFVGLLRRTRSDSSSIASRRKIMQETDNDKGGSVVGGSMVSSASQPKKRKRGSVINGSYLTVETIDNKEKARGGAASSIILGSELGPSASQVAAAVVNRGAAEGGSALDEREEGFRSKLLERWRAELPPMFDRGSDYSGHRHKGLFSCFGKICGIECSIVCGGNNSAGNNSSRRHKRSFSDGLSYVSSDPTFMKR